MHTFNFLINLKSYVIAIIRQVTYLKLNRKTIIRESLKTYDQYVEFISLTNDGKPSHYDFEVKSLGNCVTRVKNFYLYKKSLKIVDGRWLGTQISYFDARLSKNMSSLKLNSL